MPDVGAFLNFGKKRRKRQDDDEDSGLEFDDDFEKAFQKFSINPSENRTSNESTTTATTKATTTIKTTTSSTARTTTTAASAGNRTEAEFSGFDDGDDDEFFSEVENDSGGTFEKISDGRSLC